MQAARLRELRRRPRRGSLERPVNGRLVRTSMLVLVLPLAIAAFTVSRARPAPGSGVACFVRRQPRRTGAGNRACAQVPEPRARQHGDDRAASWFAETLAQYGLAHGNGRRGASAFPDSARSSSETSPSSCRARLGERSCSPPTATRAGSARAPTTTPPARGTDPARASVRHRRLGPAYGRNRCTRCLFLSSRRGGLGGTRCRPFRNALALSAAICWPRSYSTGSAGAGSPRHRHRRGRRPITGPGARTYGGRTRPGADRRAPRAARRVRQLVDLGMPFGFGDQAPFLGARTRHCA